MLHQKYTALSQRLDEAALRLWAATEARALGRGGISTVARTTGLSRTTIHAGMKELLGDSPISIIKQKEAPIHHIRLPGGGRKKLVNKDPQMLDALRKLVEPHTRGDPQSPLFWTCKSTTNIASELTKQGHTVSQRTVCDLLAEMGYSLQSTRKTREGSQHTDRNAQFEYIAKLVDEFHANCQPVVSVDTKKKELIGDFANAGREWHQKGQPEEVRDHDFPDKKLGKVAPYGVYDIMANVGWVSVGIDHDTAEFAVESIRRWWREMGSPMYPDAKSLMITADCGGSNGYRLRLWKMELQKLADELGIPVSVCHLPPGTSKWNKIEHRMFCHITQNWRGRPLLSREVVVNLIGQTTTSAGLKIRAQLDLSHYDSGIKVSDEELAKVALEPNSFHGEWNYTIHPRRS